MCVFLEKMEIIVAIYRIQGSEGKKEVNINIK
jgi:hypothetical protein